MLRECSVLWSGAQDATRGPGAEEYSGGLAMHGLEPGAVSQKPRAGKLKPKMPPASRTRRTGSQRKHQTGQMRPELSRRCRVYDAAQ